MGNGIGGVANRSLRRASASGRVAGEWCRVLGLGAVFLCAMAAPALAYRYPDTGQTACYQTVSPFELQIPCAGTGQDGEYVFNAMNFTDNGDGTVTDNNTGLVWQKQDNGVKYNWYQATGTCDAVYNPPTQSPCLVGVDNPGTRNICGSLNLGAVSGWRLPSIVELMTIVDYGVSWPGPTIDAAYFPDTKPSYYWSATSYPLFPKYAWHVLFYNASSSAFFKGSKLYVRCVRGE